MVKRWIHPTALPYLIVGIVLVGLVATLLPALPRSMADTIGAVTITQGKAEAVVKDGTTEVCVIRATSTFNGDASKVGQLMEAVSQSARGSGMTAEASGSDLSLSQEFNLTQWSIAPEECSMDSLVSHSRGRSALEIPKWARGMLAAAANIAVYVAVTLSVMALFTFLAPEFEVYGLLVSGCVAGFASSYVGNLINQVPQQQNLTYSAAKCVAGAITNVTLARTVAQMMKALRAYLGTGGVGNVAGQAVVDNLALGESARTSITDSLRRESLRFAEALG